MAKKKTPPLVVSQEDETQAQHVLEQYHQVAKDLHESTSREQADEALTIINSMPESTQIALLKALSKELHSDAADVLVALNELSPVKNIRKEARRSLIQLEGARIRPQWNPPVEHPPAVETQLTGNPPRFWKGIVTDSRDIGEVQLVLLWEQGADYKDVRVLGFLLEFWHDGVKDFFTQIESKRSVEKLIDMMMAEMPEVKTKPCSLADGRHLLLEALAVNQRHGTLPYKDYRFNVSLVNRLVLSAPDLEEEEADLEGESEDRLVLHDLSPMEVVMKFVESWSDDDYGVAYDFLTSDSPIREGLSREEWIERREEWSEEANQVDLEPAMIYEREPQKPKLWLPNLVAASRSTTRKEIEAGWSIELDETPLSETLPELPTATLVYEDTGRHWFWASYILMQEQGEWRIQNINDEGANAQVLSPAELRKRIQERDERIIAITKKHKPTDADALQYLEEISLYMMQSIYYSDALIKVLPYDISNYEQAIARMLEFGHLERCVAYLELQLQRFEDQRAQRLRRLSAVRRQLSQKYFDIGDEERGEQCLERAAENLRESLALENSFETHISLADVLLEQDESLEEVEEHLLQAKAMVTNPTDEAHIEMHLGEIATAREQYEEALRHHLRVAELTPGNVDSWVDLAKAYEDLQDFEKADASYRRAIQLQPDNEDLYYALSKMYSENNQLAKAIEVIEDGLSANPDSAVLNVYLATTYLDNQDYRQAEIFLERAERLDPELEAVKMMRQVLNWSKPKTKTVPIIGKLSRHKLKKKGKK